ncbi:hypothetical protein BK126_06540 [Paenibacillus sp. FSL H7-0326]|uniref:DUF6886 family protein n=1 Tax=Paenibacillus sp. FSL H7-0326 TaxID=1921144 RepID=UPI00096F4C1D|nr:DUF6886 family protein [Paenibacillus sp. FSL H7-0326]OMC71714.1 hypothetical protein BK126_06540 [Paenibacillus sp. FSL H7-0326]
MLFHFSEDDSINIFVPKQKQNRPDFPAVVWAIDEEHEFSYYFPRDCPRIVCRKDEATTDQQLQLFFNNSITNTIVTVESDWYTKILKQSIFKYCFDDEGFELFDKTAGYYISRQTVKPKSVEKYENLLERLLVKGIELRFTTNLYPLREAILASDFKGYGIHRFNNAKRL